MQTEPKPDGGPAFPSEQGKTFDGEWNQTIERGMTLLDWFAGQAMKAYIEHLSRNGQIVSRSHGEIASESYAIAHTMLEARSK